jgi:hypothetical protein
MEMFFPTPLAALQLGLLILVAGAAFWKGAGPERWCAGALVWMRVVDWPYHAIFGSIYFATVDVGHFLIDLSVLVVFVVVALQANRLYPICLAGFQFVSLLSHVVALISPDIAARAYFFLIVMPSHLEIVTLGIGTALHIRRVRKFGTYRAWRSSSTRSRGTPRASPPNA